MERHEARTKTPYIEIISILDKHPPIRDALKGFLEKWEGTEIFDKAREIVSKDIVILGPLKAAGKMAENKELMKEAIEVMEVVCENIARPSSRLEFLLKIRPKEEALSAVTQEYLLEEVAKGLGFAQKPKIQKFLNREIERVDPENHGFVLERTPDGRASIYYSYKHSGPGKGFLFKMWPPAILSENNKTGLVLYFLTSSWELIKQERKSL